MNLKFNLHLKLCMVSLWLIVCGCVKDKEFDTPKKRCSDAELTSLTISQLKDLYLDETIQIQEDWVIEGYITSSDKAGNFFNVLHFQDSPSNPTDGLQIELELRDSHLFFDVGQRIFIKLKGLYLGKSSGVFKIGGVFTSFGNRSVGRLPNSVVFDHILLSCESNIGIEPAITTLAELNENMVNTLVSIETVEFLQLDVGEPFAVVKKETERILINCNDEQLVLLNSGFSDFQSESIPSESGKITGVLTRDKGTFQLIIRTLDDIDFSNERCEDIVDEFTADTILISEIADPDNNAAARFIELYNSSNESFSLKGWMLVRYTNANSTVSSTIDLSDFIIEGKGLLTISPNGAEFEDVYGVVPDVLVGTNSPADSNGDDTIVLLDPFGAIIDIFGIIGEDGSGTNHEFEDGRANRALDVVNGNAVFRASEWFIYNDTGEGGTINQPQNAPSDFSPGVR